MYKWIKFGGRIFLFVLQNHPSAKINPPTEHDLQKYADAIAAKYPLLGEEKVWGAADGLKLQLQRSSDWTQCRTDTTTQRMERVYICELSVCLFP